MDPDELYRRYTRAIDGAPLPLALVDLDAVDHNIESLLRPVRENGKTLRVASKSIRCVELLRYITERANGAVRGLMSYTCREAEYLVGEGFDDVLVAYPTLQKSDAELLAELNRGDATVSVVVDDIEQLDALNRVAQPDGGLIPVIVDVDLSYRPLGGLFHLGVRRSPLHSVDAVVELVDQIASRSGLIFHGVMGYEAQIAGLTDDSPFSPYMNGPKRLLKGLSRGPVVDLRAAIVEALRARDVEIAVFNGGGTGSLEWCASEDALTEVTAGSGFLDSHLFDYYRGLDIRPAAYFALQAVRRPAKDMVTCHGGGYVASGEAGKDRLPVPALPAGLSLVDLEGAGEVQTPVAMPEGLALPLGAPIFFRHAKAGELAEHFNEYLLVRGRSIERRVATYRGAGRCFL